MNVDYVRILRREEMSDLHQRHPVPVVVVIAERVDMYHKGRELFDPMDIWAVY